MHLGHDRPLFILPFDHRASFEKGLFGFSSPLTAEQTTTVAESKQVVYDGFKRALAKGAPRGAAGILVDEQFGAAILRDPRSRGFITCAQAEPSGQEEFAFEYGDRRQEHIEGFAPTFVKVLVRYNPESDAATNRRQVARLKELSDYCHRNGHHFMFELLVPMTHEQSDRLEGDQRHYDRELRPFLMIPRSRSYRKRGAEPDVWRSKGSTSVAIAKPWLRRRDATGGAASAASFWRGSDESGILAWLRAAAQVPGFIGFAVGRTSFWDALVGLRDLSAMQRSSRSLTAARNGSMRSPPNAAPERRRMESIPAQGWPCEAPCQAPSRIVRRDHE
jgi:myo-inositol catabolism protein IolC